MNRYFLIISAAVCLVSCDLDTSENAGRHIILGDSSTIVTETDGQYLKNNFDDITFKPVIATIDTVETSSAVAVTDIAQPSGESAGETDNAEAEGSGYEIKLNHVTLVLEGKTDKQVRKSSTASYVINPRNYPDKVISKNGEGTIKYRYVSVPYYVKDGRKIKLTQLGEYRSDWKTVASQNGVFRMPAIETKPQFKNVTAASLQKAINNGVASLKLSQKEKNKLAADIKKVTSTGHNSIDIIVEKVEWDILVSNKSDKMFFTF